MLRPPLRESCTAQEAPESGATRERTMAGDGEPVARRLFRNPRRGHDWNTVDSYALDAVTRWNRAGVAVSLAER